MILFLDIKYAFLLLLVGAGLFLLLSFLFSIPGSGKIDAVYTDEKVKKEERIRRKKIYKTFLIVYISMLLIFFILFYLSI